MRLGVCYYPEQWDRSLWRDDAARMADLGLEVVRIGEFSWSRIEPSPDVFEWEWYDEAIGVLADAGLEIILGTPTATPPKWLVDKHPEILAHDAQGRPRRFGSRRHYCFSSTTYAREAQRITAAVAKRYGAHSAVTGWQTDNEYGCHDTVRSYSTAAAEAFRRWLDVRYGEIELLNKAWGTVFWSQTYRSFAEIDLPNLTVTEPNPSHVLDFYRFASDQVIAFNRMQTEIIRAHAPGRDIFHNFMGLFTDFDHFKLSEAIDVAGWDSYPLGFLDIGPYARDDKEKYMRQGHPDFAAFHHDLYRGCGRGRFAVLEQQPGPVNWARNNPAPAPGIVRLWTHEAAAHGAEILCYFRWRQAPFAQEQMHAGLLRPDGAPAAAYAEVKETSRELRTLAELKSEPATTKPATVALVFSYETQWMSKIQPQGSGWDYLRMAMEWYGAARQLGYNIDIVAQGAPLNGYDAILVPTLFHIDHNALDAFKNAGAPILFGPRCGSKTATMQIPEGLAPGLLQSLLPVKVSHSESFPDSYKLTGTFNGEDIVAKRWLDHFETDLTPAAHTNDGAGLLYQSDRFWLFSCCPDSDFLSLTLQAALKKSAYVEEAGQDGVRVRTSGTLCYAFNYGAHPVQLKGTSQDKGFELLLSQRDLAPYDVAVFRNPNQTKKP